MAGLDPAISREADGRVKPGHDDIARPAMTILYDRP